MTAQTHISNDVTSLGVAYDSHRDIFYWTVAGENTRLRQLTAGSTMPRELPFSVLNPTSVVVDYIGERLYWIEENGVCVLLFCWFCVILCLTFLCDAPVMPYLWLEHCSIRL